jgi:hypothetical protein
MKQETKDKLRDAYDLCKDKSIEYTIQYMKDYANVDFDCVIKFLEETSNEQRK